MRKCISITDPKDLVVGEEFHFTCNGRGRGGHYSVFAKVTKVNRKTVAALELPRSYWPGTRWSVSISELNPAYKYIEVE